MSNLLPKLSRSSSGVSSPPLAAPFQATARTQRVLACVLCQQRKVKCDRKFPCANCIRAQAQCVPATLAPRKRRRRFAERELLEQLRRYEELLNQNNIKFVPLRTPAAKKTSPGTDGRDYDSSDDAQSEGRSTGADAPSREKTAVKPKAVYEARNIWHAMNQRSRDPENDNDNVEDDSDSSHGDVREVVIKKAWDQLYDSNEHLLFGSRKTNVNLSTLHPTQVQIFRLWQIYLDNVNPLLKVTHTPTLQIQIIDAASDMTNINPSLEALIFGIYCISILSLVEDECRAIFQSSREDLLTRYQLGCQHALLNCGFLRSGDRDCLTALYLYLVSARHVTDPRSLSSMLGLVTRIAQRMGVHSESANAKCTALEAEMRRRLWWSLVIFDTRICEMSDYKTAMLVPTWDCGVPLNLNDFDLRPEMKIPPVPQGQSTEALFVVVRAELGEFVRHSSFHLNFINPALKTVARDVQHGPVPEGGEMVILEKMIEDRYLKSCNSENPVHFMTIWTARGYLAKNRLMEHYSRYSRSCAEQTEAQRDAAISYALSMLECDTKLMASPLTKGFLWYIHFHFPFLPYVHIVQDLRRQPMRQHVEKIWAVMSENYKARFVNMKPNDNPFFKVFARTILQAWAAYEAVFRLKGEPPEPPLIVSEIKRKVMQMTLTKRTNDVEHLNNGVVSMNTNDYSTPMSMDLSGPGLLYSTGGQQGPENSTPQGFFPHMSEQAMMEVDMNQLDWTAIDWNQMHDMHDYEL